MHRICGLSHVLISNNVIYDIVYVNNISTICSQVQIGRAQYPICSPASPSRSPCVLGIPPFPYSSLSHRHWAASVSHLTPRAIPAKCVLGVVPRQSSGDCPTVSIGDIPGWINFRKTSAVYNTDSARDGYSSWRWCRRCYRPSSIMHIAQTG